MAQNSRPRVDRAIIPGDGVAALSVLMNRAVSADPRLKSSIGALHADPAGRAVAEGVIAWFWASPLPALYRTLVGQEPALLIDFTTVRRHVPGRADSRVAWHADANFTGLSGTMRVMWVPVDPVGVDAPGLEFAFPTEPVRRRTIEEYLMKASGNPGHTLAEDDVLAMFGGAYRSWRPTLDPGDVLVFDQWGFHRTDPRLDRKARTAIEFRMVSLVDPPRRVMVERRLTASALTADGRWVLRPAAELVAAAGTPGAAGR